MIIASATCVRQAGFPKREPNGARDLMDVQAVIVPGVGVAACQAGVDNTRENQMLVYNEIKKGTPPAQILEMLKKDPNIERRQFGILAIPNGGTITAQNNRAGFNGSGNSRVVAVFRRRRSARHLLSGAGQHAARRSGDASGGARLYPRDRHAGRPSDGGDGSRRRQRRRPSLQLRQQPARTPCPATTGPLTSPTSPSPTRTTKPGVTHNDGKYFAYLSVTDDNTKPGRERAIRSRRCACATTRG